MASAARDGRIEIGDRPAAKALQQRRGFQRKDRRADLFLARRQKQRSGVAEELDQHAAGCDRHQQPELRSRVTPIRSSATPSVTIVSTSRPAPNAGERIGRGLDLGRVSAGSAGQRPPRSCARPRAPSATTG